MCMLAKMNVDELINEYELSEKGMSKHLKRPLVVG